MVLYIKKHKWSILIAGLIILNLFLIVSFFGYKLPSQVFVSGSDVSINRDLEDFKTKDFKNFKELSVYFTQLAERKGGEYAFNLLKVAPVPPNTDMHLLGHVVGDVLYKQEGLKGMYKCTPDFRNACSHTIVVGLLLEKGESALGEIATACKDAPGGSGAYTMCFHGLGHGVLAYNGYDLDKTVAMCEKTGTPDYHGREVGECIGGAIMEMIGGGFHDMAAWERERPKYLSDNAPLEPCSLDIIPSESKPLCYMYLTPHLFKAAGANLTSPSPSTFPKAFSFCDKISPNDGFSRQSCFGGFGKEFVVLVKDRDIRKMDNFTDTELKTVQNWCGQAKVNDGINYCIGGAVSSLFWGGENDPKTSIQFCAVADKAFSQNCYDVLVGNAYQYLKSNEAVNNFCSLLPEIQKQKCLRKLQ